MPSYGFSLLLTPTCYVKTWPSERSTPWSVFLACLCYTLTRHLPGTCLHLVQMREGQILESPCLAGPRSKAQEVAQLQSTVAVADSGELGFKWQLEPYRSWALDKEGRVKGWTVTRSEGTMAQSLDPSLLPLLQGR